MHRSAEVEHAGKLMRETVHDRCICSAGIVYENTHVRVSIKQFATIHNPARHFLHQPSRGSPSLLAKPCILNARQTNLTHASRWFPSSEPLLRSTSNSRRAAIACASLLISSSRFRTSALNRDSLSAFFSNSSSRNPLKCA